MLLSTESVHITYRDLKNGRRCDALFFLFILLIRQLVATLSAGSSILVPSLYD